jgi:hypothetical protein
MIWVTNEDGVDVSIDHIVSIQRLPDTIQSFPHTIDVSNLELKKLVFATDVDNGFYKGKNTQHSKLYLSDARKVLKNPEKYGLTQEQVAPYTGTTKVTYYKAVDVNNNTHTFRGDPRNLQEESF